MIEVALTLLGILIGVAATIFVAHHYFKRSTTKSLTPYLHFASPVLAGIDPEVRKDLDIRYLNIPVGDLYQIQFLVANTGERAIRDCLEPLTLQLPKKVSVLDASILHIQPEGRVVTIQVESSPHDGDQVQLVFPLLDKNEYFLVKLLLHGDPNIRDLRFTISVDDLPPTLDPVPLPFEYMFQTQPRKVVEWVPLAGGLLMLLLSVAVGFTLLTLRNTQPTIFPLPWDTFEPSWASLAVALTAGLALVLFFLGAVAMPSAAFNIRRPPFVLPKHLHQGPGWFPLFINEAARQRARGKKGAPRPEKSQKSSTPSKS